MNGSRPTPSRRGETSSLDALNRTIEGLEARIEGLMHSSARERQNGERQAGDGREQRRHAEQPAPQQPAQKAAPQPAGQLNPLEEIRRRQRALDAARHPEREVRPVEREVRPPEAYAEPAPRAPIAPRRPVAPATAYADNRAPRAESRPLASAVAARAAAPAVLPDAIMNDIAEALVSLRQDLKQDISQGVAREMDGLRTEIRSIRAIAEDRHFADDMRNDLARLADSIGSLNHRGAPETDDLREEFEGLRAAMQGLAREDTVQRMETQFLGLEERVLDADPQALREELVALAYRIDDIKTQLGAVGDNRSILALEDKLLTLAAAVEQLGNNMVPHNDPMIVEQFSMLDKRLDEISRALAASSRASADAALDHGMIGRLESRLEGLADQIDAMHRDALQSAIPAPNAMDDEMGVRIEALARKIDDFSREQGAMRLDERLEDLAILMERVQQPAQPAELTGYLSDISRKIDALEQGSVNDALAERLDYISRRIEEIEVAQPAAPVDNELFGRLEGRLSDIAARLDDAASAPASDNDALRNLEDQIANLSRLISEPKPAADAFELPAAFEERMSAIEGYMATSDEYVIEAARQAAEAVVEAYARNGAASGGAAPDMGALTALAEDLRHLEDLTRGSEERTHQTFEMLHRTLVSIADRLDTMEGSIARQGTFEPARAAPAPAPSPTRTSMQAAPATQAPAAQVAPAAQAAPVMPKAAVPMFAGGDDLHNSVALPVAPHVDDRLDERALFADDLESGLLENGEASDDHENAQRTADSESRALATDGKGRASLLGGMKRFLAGHREPEPTASGRAFVEPTPSIDPVDMLPPEQQNIPLEPGSGMPDVKKILERVRASQAGQAGNAATADGESVDYIAAARRAAKAAAMETDPTLAVSAGSRGKGKTKDSAVKAGRAAVLKPQKTSGLAGTFARHRKPILLAVGAVLLALMAMPLVNTLTRGDDAPAAPPEMGMVAPGENTGEAEPATGMTANEADTSLQDTPRAEPRNEAPADGGEASAPVPDVAQAPLEAARPETQPVEAPQAPSAETAPAAAAPQAAIEVPATMGPKSLADAAASGDPQALFEIGARYQDGRGVAANLPEAVRWYEMAAQRGLAPAQYRVANLYEKGTGVARDFGKAMAFYEQAAQAGNASAMHNLAVLYASGASGTPDYAKAVSWFEKAADLGVSDSQFNLAILFARGNGVPQNLDASYKWFSVAARGGDQDAAQKRDEVGSAMTPAQLEAAKTHAEQWQVKPVDPNANSVNLPDEWVGKGEKTASVDMEKAIRNIQAILNKNGFDAGAPDGKMGAKTVTAIRSFQKANGMEQDGKVSEPLVRKLLTTNQG